MRSKIRYCFDVKGPRLFNNIRYNIAPRGQNLIYFYIKD